MSCSDLKFKTNTWKLFDLFSFHCHFSVVHIWPRGWMRPCDKDTQCKHTLFFHFPSQKQCVYNQTLYNVTLTNNHKYIYKATQLFWLTHGSSQTPTNKPSRDRRALLHLGCETNVIDQIVFCWEQTGMKQYHYSWGANDLLSVAVSCFCCSGPCKRPLWRG